jgi:hypothetical protein
MSERENGGAERVEILDEQLADTRLARVTASRIGLGPGEGGGLHRHPCPVAGVVLAGRIRYQVVGSRPVVLGPGEAFYEPADALIAEFRNASDVEPASFAAFYLRSGDEAALIEMLD